MVSLSSVCSYVCLRFSHASLAVSLRLRPNIWGYTTSTFRRIATPSGWLQPLTASGPILAPSHLSISLITLGSLNTTDCSPHFLTMSSVTFSLILSLPQQSSLSPVWVTLSILLCLSYTDFIWLQKLDGDSTGAKRGPFHCWILSPQHNLQHITVYGECWINTQSSMLTYKFRKRAHFLSSLNRSFLCFHKVKAWLCWFITVVGFISHFEHNFFSYLSANVCLDPLLTWWITVLMYLIYVLIIFCNLYCHHLLTDGGGFWAVLWVSVGESLYWWKQGCTSLS